WSSDVCSSDLLGLVLYDVDAVLPAASVEDDHDLLDAQRELILDPNDPEVIRAAEREGIPRDWIEAARRSPIHSLINKYRVALPLHPVCHTMPMVWYIPPLSPIVDSLSDAGTHGDIREAHFAAIESRRLPVEYLAELFTAGDPEPVTDVLRRLAAMRSYMRDINLGQETDEELPRAVGMDGESMYQMYRLLALAKYEDRYVIPPAHSEQAHS